MARTTLALTSFVSGELGSKLDGRTDFDKYRTGCKTLENFLVHPQGAATRRVGTQFISEVKTSANKTRLIPFEFSTTQTYILEFGNQYIRFYKDKGQILSGGSAYEIASPYLTAELFEIKFAQSADVLYICHPNHAVRKLSRTGHTSWTLEELLFTYGPFLDDNTETTTLSSSAISGNSVTITASAITGINNNTGFQTTDVGRLVSIGYGLGYAEITARTSTTVVTADILETLAPKVNPSKLSKEISASDTTIVVDKIDDYAATGTIRIDDELITYTGKDAATRSFTGCTRGTSSTTAVTHRTLAYVYSTENIATTKWKLGAFSNFSGHPACVSFFEQRLVFAGTNTEPQTIYFSKSGDYENFATGTLADDAMIYTIASNQVNRVRYLKAQRTLIIGTTGGEFTVTADGTDAAVTPTNLTIKKQSSFGTADVDALPVGNAVIFLQKAKRKFRELAYNFDSDGYVAPDLTILNDAVTDSGINEFTYQQEPSSILWAVRDDGILIGLTYQRSENVVAWHKHKLGGSFGTNQFGIVESIASISGTLDEDELWVIVKRTINGSTKRYIECFSDFDFDETNSTDFKFLDSFLTYSGPSTTLNGTISSSATSIVLTDASSFTATGTILIDNERISYTGKSTNTLTGCTRGFNSTAAATHTTGATVKQVVNSFSGLSHLEAQSVGILADGSTHANKTVSSGAITLDRYVNKAAVGLNYSSVLQTMRIEGGAEEGTSQGKTKRISKVVLRLFETVGVRVGPDLNNLETIPFRSSSDPMDTPVSTFLAGDKEIEFRDDYNTDGFIFVKQEQALPCSVLAIYPTVVTSDG